VLPIKVVTRRLDFEELAKNETLKLVDQPDFNQWRPFVVQKSSLLDELRKYFKSELYTDREILFLKVIGGIID